MAKNIVLRDGKTPSFLKFAKKALKIYKIAYKTIYKILTFFT